MTSERRYSDNEVALILKRAAEMSQAKTAGGMTAAELERIALEAGIDPAAVRLAAEEVSRGSVKGGGAGELFLGGPTSLRYVFELDGELSEEHHEALLAAVQRGLDVPGTINVAGRSFSWHSLSQNRNLVVQVTPSRGKTVVRVEERLGALIGGIYGGVGGGVGGSLVPLAGFAGAALLGPAGIVAALALSSLGTYVGTRAIFAAVARRRKKRLEALSEDLRRTLEEVLPKTAASTTTTTTTTTTESALASARERQGLASAPDADDAAASDAHEERAEMRAAEERGARRGS